jgi:hypothetical protein
MIVLTDIYQNSAKSSSKRRLESPDGDDDGDDDSDDNHPLKRYRLTSVYDDDMDQIKGELRDIKACLNGIAEQLQKML